MEIKRMRVLQYEEIEPLHTEKEINFPSGNDNVHDSCLIIAQESLMERLDKVTVSLKALNPSLEERNHLNVLRDLGVKTHLWTLDSRVELLNGKHENLEMIMDNLVADLMSYKQ